MSIPAKIIGFTDDGLVESIKVKNGVHFIQAERVVKVEISNQLVSADSGLRDKLDKSPQPKFDKGYYLVRKNDDDVHFEKLSQNRAFIKNENPHTVFDLTIS